VRGNGEALRQPPPDAIVVFNSLLLLSYITVVSATAVSTFLVIPDTAPGATNRDADILSCGDDSCCTHMPSLSDNGTSGKGGCFATTSNLLHLNTVVYLHTPLSPGDTFVKASSLSGKNPIPLD
jgi:hypothetical protein